MSATPNQSITVVFDKPKENLLIQLLKTFTKNMMKALSNEIIQSTWKMLATTNIQKQIMQVVT